MDGGMDMQTRGYHAALHAYVLYEPIYACMHALMHLYWTIYPHIVCACAFAALTFR